MVVTYDLASRPVLDDDTVPAPAVDRPDLSTKSVSVCGVTEVAALYTDMLTAANSTRLRLHISDVKTTMLPKVVFLCHFFKILPYSLDFGIN